MPDPAVQLARLHQAGFEIQTFDRYPRAVGVARKDCLALFEPQADGLKLVGRPGWRLGESIGVLVEKQGKQFFQAKNEVVEATAERLKTLREFEEEINQLLLSTA